MVVSKTNKSNTHYKADFGFKPYPLQQEIINDGHRFKVLAFGRQSGKSWFAKFTALDKAINHKKQVMWVSPTIPTARTHWNELVKLLTNSKLPIQHIKQASKEIFFYGGGYIAVRSAVQPDNLRGASLDYLILDECAFFRNGEYVWNAVCLPMVTATKGEVILCSTPNGRNWFYDVFAQGQGDDEYYKSWNIPSTASPYQDVKLLNKIRQSLPERRWREEYLAEFIKDSGGVFVGVDFSVDFLDSPLPNHHYVVGIDWGGTQDYTVLSVWDKFSSELVYIDRFLDLGVTGTIDRLVLNIEKWQPDTAYVEANGMGATAFQVLKERRGEFIGKTRLVPIIIDNHNKRDMIERLSVDLEFKRAKVLKEDTPMGRLLIGEMSTFERIETRSGQGITYGAKEGCHDDIIMATALGYLGIDRRMNKEVVPLRVEERAKNPFKNRRVKHA